MFVVDSSVSHDPAKSIVLRYYTCVLAYIQVTTVLDTSSNTVMNADERWSYEFNCGCELGGAVVPRSRGVVNAFKRSCERVETLVSVFKTTLEPVGVPLGVLRGGTGSTRALKRGVRGVLQAVGSTPKGSPNPKLY